MATERLRLWAANASGKVHVTDVRRIGDTYFTLEKNGYFGPVGMSYCEDEDISINKEKVFAVARTRTVRQINGLLSTLDTYRRQLDRINQGEP